MSPSHVPGDGRVTTRTYRTGGSPAPQHVHAPSRPRAGGLSGVLVATADMVQGTALAAQLLDSGAADTVWQAATVADASALAAGPAEVAEVAVVDLALTDDRPGTEPQPGVSELVARFGVGRRVVAVSNSRDPVAVRDAFAAGATAFLINSVPSRRTRPLSVRETLVVRLAATGRSNDEIAAQLGISKDTVKSHFTRIHRKLGTASRAGTVLYALRTGLID